MVIAANLGFPRIGADRELKKSVEAFWKGQSSETTLMQTAADLRRSHWVMQHQAGIRHIPSNDFSFYDQVLDTSVMVGAVPARYAALDKGLRTLLRHGAWHPERRQGHCRNGNDQVV